MVPYNGSIFQLKNKYKNVFRALPDLNKEETMSDSINSVENLSKSIKFVLNKPSLRFYKIKYTINCLPICTYLDGRSQQINELMDSLGESEELEIFEAKVVNDYYVYQWERYAKHIHYFGAFVHFIYLFLFILYVNLVYLDRNFDNRVNLIYFQLICLVYPAIYDSLQWRKAGFFNYFKDPWNFIDQCHIWIGLANLL